MRREQFQVGEKVAHYSAVGKVFGFFQYADEQGNACITVNGSDKLCHLKQLRRLKPCKAKEAQKTLEANQAAVGAFAGFTFFMDPNIPEDEVRLRMNGKDVLTLKVTGGSRP